MGSRQEQMNETLLADLFQPSTRQKQQQFRVLRCHSWKRQNKNERKKRKKCEQVAPIFPPPTFCSSLTKNYNFQMFVFRSFLYLKKKGKKFSFESEEFFVGGQFCSVSHGTRKSWWCWECWYNTEAHLISSQHDVHFHLVFPVSVIT